MAISPSADTSASTSPSTALKKSTPPSPGRIVEAIAAFPYSAKVALMDIADNAVENGADNVLVEFALADKVIASIVIADNGTGIADDVLDEVLRAGSQTRHLYGPQSLSRFGIGLKGAGFALARRITVLTANGNGFVQRRSIDRDEIEKSDMWEQEIRSALPAEAEYFQTTMQRLPGTGQRETGTIVILEKVLLQTRDLSRLRTELVRTVGETYGKFLAGARPGMSRLVVRVDETDVEPIDPLHRENEGTTYLIKRHNVEFADGSMAFVTAVALPHPHTVTPELDRKYRYQQKYQGIYIYRNGRLIAGGQTLNLFGRDFHLNAFRVELEYSTDADDNIRVDVAKSTIILSDDAETKLKPLITPAARTASTLWREKDVLTKADIQGLFDESNKQIASRSNLLIEAIKTKKADAARKAKPNAKPGHRTPTDQPAAKQEPQPTKKPKYGYLRPQDTLPEDVLYRPMLDGDFGVVVEVNLAHPFSKAVFDVSPGEGKKALPRRATTAAQQLLYVLGQCEYSMTDEPEDARQFEQFRRYVSMNLRALLTD